MGALGLNCCLHGIACPGEREEKRIALRVDLDAVGVCERVANDAPVLGQNFRVAVAELFEQRRRALDVREDERDRPARQP